MGNDNEALAVNVILLQKLCLNSYCINFNRDRPTVDYVTNTFK